MFGGNDGDHQCSVTVAVGDVLLVAYILWRL